MMRIGVDLGGTKIEGVVLRGESEVLLRRRLPTPAGQYAATLATVAELVCALEQEAGAVELPVGVGHPGSIAPHSGRIRNANSTCLNDRALRQDLEQALGRRVAMANDADCLALSEAFDGAAAGARSVFAVILGTGVGGGLAVEGRLLGGPNGTGGELGHNPLPWPRPEWGELPGPACWHGLHGCIETWLSGPAMAADHLRAGGEPLSAEAIAARAEAGEPQAAATLARYIDRLARTLAHVINLIDPQVIVLGGGVSQVASLYREVPARWGHWVFSDRVDTPLRPARHGDSSGVLGAARLNPGSQRSVH
jgi:fructokinase